MPRAMGWEPDPIDGNALDWKLELGDMVADVADTDLRRFSPPVTNQGRNGSCVAHVVAGLIYATQARLGARPVELPSIAALWWLMRKERGLERFNVGGWLRQALRLARTHGFCRARHMPVSTPLLTPVSPKVERFCIDQARAHAEKLGRDPVEYRRIRADKGEDQVQAFRLALWAGFQIGAGWDVSERFTKARFDPTEPYTRGPGEEVLGGHAMRVVASVPGGFRVTSSWSKSWADGGSFIMSNEEAGRGRDPWVVVTAPTYSDRVAA